MSPEKKIRTQAKAILSKNNMAASIGVIITLGVAMMAVLYFSDALVIGIDFVLSYFNINIFDTYPIISIVTLLAFMLIGFCFILPLLMGSVRFMYQMSKTSKADFSEMFYYCKSGSYMKSLITYLGLIARSFWQFAISFIPGIIAYLYAEAVSSSEEAQRLSILLYLLSYVLLVGGLLFFNALTTNYFLAIYYYIENENLSTSEICKLSKQYMNKFGGTTVMLNFSLLPMNLLCLLIVPALIVLPYIMTAKATSAKWIIELSKQTDNKDE